jgi:hypothetical protein
MHMMFVDESGDPGYPAVCSNVFFREIGRNKGDPEYRRLVPRFWRHNNRIQGYGIKRWPL